MPIPSLKSSIDRSISRSKGFTLIELLIISIIFGIIASIGIPSLVNFIASQRVDGSQNILLRSLKFTRSEAVTRNAPVSMCIANTANTCDAAGTATWNQGWHIFVDINSNRTIDIPDDTILKTQNALPDLTFNPTPSDTRNISFSATGRLGYPAAGVAQFEICNFDSSNSNCADDQPYDSALAILGSGQVVATP